MTMKNHTALSRKGEMLSALAVVILLIGTATGSAIALLAMSMIGLSLMTVFYRKQFSRGLVLAAAMAAITAIGISLIMSMK